MAAPLSSSTLTISILLFICFLSSSSSSSVDVLGGKKLVGGKTEIKDVKTNKQVQELGKYSVTQYNLKFKKGDKGSLTFKEVVKAQSQVVAGIQYFLKVSAIQNGKPKLYDAVVVVKAWQKPSNLLVSFNPSSN
ncbi:cysteine proteinase inhibitor B-like [Papaver somniferum]|uniref:cysteine proteinase inhibitor B-like n=1 Tax=Papaver somniferum TaxID=3469 RepID=UPI000E6FD759|nr:cysteine proteinase inhibitor B-like [Papaver somniferum]